MFDQATATADHRHRSFFAEAGDARQVWAREGDGGVVYLEEGGVSDEIRRACSEGRLTCPMEDCPDPRLVAKGGRERRHHFAHRVAHVRHKRGDVWRREGLEMLRAWLADCYPRMQLQVEDERPASWLTVTSPKSGRTLQILLTYDRTYSCWEHLGLKDRQVIVGHTRGLLLPRREVEQVPGAWWCGEGRLIGDLIQRDGWALAVNPERRLVATLMNAGLAAGLHPRLKSGWPVACLISEMHECRLTDYGLSTPWVEKVLATQAAMLWQPRGAPPPPPPPPPPIRTRRPQSRQPSQPAPRISREEEYRRRAAGLDTDARLALLKEMFLASEQDEPSTSSRRPEGPR